MLLDRVIKKLGISNHSLDMMGVYDIQNVSDYLFEFPSTSYLDENTQIYFPHELTWYEWKVKNDNPPFQTMEYGVLFMAPNIEVIGRRIASVMVFCAKPGNNPICLSEGSLEIDLKSKCVKTGKHGIYYQSNPVKVLGGLGQVFGPPESGRICTKDEEGQIVEMVMHRTHMACEFMKCVNVAKEINEVPEKLMKKYQKHGSERYVMKHYTLGITGLKAAIKAAVPNAKEIGFTKAWYICRGHFKTYTDENPLFGKVTGTFFWGAQVRGHKDKGVVKKNYRVDIDPKCPKK